MLFSKNFVCKVCQQGAETEHLCEGVLLIACSECEITEVLSETEPEPLDHFEFFSARAGLG